MAFLLWVVGAVLLVVITVLLLLAKWRTRDRGSGYILDAESCYKEIADNLAKELPLHSTRGWSVHSVRNGLRVFQQPVRDLPVPRPLHTQQHHVLAASLILDMSTKRSLAVACYVKELSNWCPRWLPGATRLPDSSSSPRQLVQFNYSIPDSVVGEWYRKVKGWTDKHTPFLRRLMDQLPSPQPTSVQAIVELYHHEGSSGSGYVFSYLRPPSHVPYLWTCLFLAPLKQEGTTLATLVAAPIPGYITSEVATAELVSGQLCALRQYITMRRFKVYSSLPNSNSSLHSSSSSHQGTNSTNQSISRTHDPVQNSTPNPTHQPVVSSRHSSNSSGASSSQRSSDSISPSFASSSPDSRGSRRRNRGSVETNRGDVGAQAERSLSNGRMRPPESPLSNGRVRSSAEDIDGSLDNTSQHSEQTRVRLVGHVAVTQCAPTVSPLLEESVTSISSLPPAASAGRSIGAHYLGMVNELCDRLIVAAAETDGWTSLGNNKDVLVMKKPPGKGEILGSFKGTGRINAPPEFLVRLLDDPTRSTELDNMLKDVRVVDKVSPAVHLVQLYYKPVWPTSARDFCMLSVSGKFADSTWVSAGKSVEDSRVPVEKGYVRAHLEFGGYVVRSVPENAEQSLVTYAGSVDMRGNIPTFVVNKVAESQPLCVSMLRKVAEPLYQELKSQPQRLREMEQQFPVGPVLPEDKSAGEEKVEQEPSNATPSQSLPLHQRLGNSQWHFDPSPEPYNSRESDLTSTVLLDRPPDCVFEEDEEKPLGQPHGVAPYDFTTPVESEDEEHVAITSDHKSNGVQPSPLISNQDGRVRGRNGDSMEELAAVGQSVVGGVGQVLGSGKRRAQSDSQVLPSNRSRMPHSQSLDGRQKARADSMRLEAVSAQQEHSNPSTRRWQQNGTSGPVPDSAVKDLRSVTKDSINYPRSDSGEVDYRTLANQAAAHVLEEVFHVGSVDVCDPNTFTNQSGGWKFEGVEKDVVILSKEGGVNRPFTSFIGRGLIPLSPTLVFDSLRNPNLRFTYDNMLKELHIVHQMEKDLFIMHVHHETTQCFIKQARDFCILVSERSEQSKKLLVGTSIETSLCPPNPGVHRGKVFCSGWVVQPCVVKGKLHTDITYILQVDLGSGVPSAIMNVISKRQPLAVAYLREYLVSTSLEASVQS